MVDLPVHPRLAAMVVDARSGPDAWTACIAAAVLEAGDVLRGRPDDLPTDLGLRVALVDDRHRSHPNAAGHTIAPGSARRPRSGPSGDDRTRTDPAPIASARCCSAPTPTGSHRSGWVAAGSCCAPGRAHGWPTPIRSPARPIWSSPTSTVSAAMLVSVSRPASTSTDLLVRFGDRVERRTMTAWDDQRNDVVARSDDVLDALTLRSVGHAVEPSPHVASVLVEAVRSERARPAGLVGSRPATAGPDRARPHARPTRRPGRRRRHPDRRARRLARAVAPRRHQRARRRPTRSGRRAARPDRLAPPPDTRPVSCPSRSCCPADAASRSTTRANARPSAAGSRSSTAVPLRRRCSTAQCRSPSSCSRRPTDRCRSPPTSPGSGPARGRGAQGHGRSVPETPLARGPDHRRTGVAASWPPLNPVRGNGRERRIGGRTP